jgi:LysM repeat protein
VVLAVIGGIYMMLGGGGVSKDEVRLIQTKIGSLEQKITALEKQQAALQARLPAEGAEAALTGKVDTLAQRVEALEKKPVAVVAEKPKAAQKEKAAASSAAPSGKKIHTVQKGETIYGISKKFGIKPDDLRKLNNLGAEDTVKPGQKLVVSK